MSSPVYISTYADPNSVRDMSGYPDTTEVPDDQLAIYCLSADAKVKSDTNLPQIDQTDPRLPVLVSAANKQGAILVRLGWNDKEGRIPILKDLYDSDIQTINQSGLGISAGGGVGGAGGAGGMFVLQSSYKTRHITNDPSIVYLSTY